MKNDNQKQTPLSDYNGSSSLSEISNEDFSLCGWAARGKAFWEAVLNSVASGGPASLSIIETNQEIRASLILLIPTFLSGSPAIMFLLPSCLPDAWIVTLRRDLVQQIQD